MATLDDVEKRLKRFVHETEGVVGVVLATSDGFTYSYYSDRAFDPDTISATVSFMFSLINRISEIADLDDPLEMNIHLAEGNLHIFPIKDMLLGVEALPDAMTGMVLVNTRRLLRDLRAMADDLF